MASQTPKAPGGRPAKVESSDQPKRGIKNPFIYAGTVIVLVIVVIAFVFVPSVGGSAAGGPRAIEFGRYSGMSIAYAQGTYFAKQVQDLNAQLRQQNLDQGNVQYFAYQVWRGAFERTLVHMAILDEARKSGAYVTESRIDDLVLEDPSFQQNGKYSPSRWRSASMAEKLAVRDTIRENSLKQQYLGDIYGLAPSSRETAFVKGMSKDTRTVEYAVFPLSAYPDADVAAWAASNTGLFRRLALSRITLSSGEADALKVLKQVKDDTVSFADAAKSHSKDAYADKGGDSGIQYFHEISGDLAKKEDAERLAALKKGELSPVLKTVAGSWVFFRADESAAAADLKDAAVLKDVRDYMSRFERGKIEDWALSKARDFAAGAAGDFQLAARKAGILPKTAGPFPLNYGDLAVSVYGQTAPIFKVVNSGNAPELAGASTSEKFLTAAFSLAPGSLSEPMVLGDNALVLRVKEAGSALDDAAVGIDLYYPYFFQQKLAVEAQRRFLTSPALTDNFLEVFNKYVFPSQPAAKN